jgi:hypothetical protein
VTFKLRYLDFWPNFSPDEFLFTHIIKDLVEDNLELVTDLHSMVDLEICSVFCFSSSFEKAKVRGASTFNQRNFSDYVSRNNYGYRREYKTKSLRRIWYSGENKRFPISIQIDGGISFDPDDNDLNNLYFPYWMTRLNWGYPKKDSSVYPAPRDLLETRNPSLKNGQICSFASNHDPARERILNALEEKFKVVRFGKSVGNLVGSKKDSSSKFSFQVCNENDLYPGYVTEKLQEAWTVGNIPIWSGLHRDNYFNEKSYLDVTDLTISQIQERIFSLTNDEIMSINSQPLLNHLPSLDPLKNFIERNL